jgi:hypothetical protein
MKLYQNVTCSTSAEVINPTFRGGGGEISNPINQLQLHTLTHLRQSSLSMHKAAMPLLRELVASLSPRSSGLNLRPACVGFLVDKVEEVQNFSPSASVFHPTRDT